MYEAPAPREIRNTDEVYDFNEAYEFNMAMGQFYLQFGKARVAFEVPRCGANLGISGNMFCHLYVVSKGGSYDTAGPSMPLGKGVHTGKAIFEMVIAEVRKYGVQICPQCNEGAAWVKPGRDHPKELGPYRPWCRTCDYKQAMAEIDAEVQKEKDKAAQRDAKMRAKGYTHKTVAWVHPSAGGDDYTIEVHSKGELPDSEIKAMLRKRRSRVLNDYRQAAL